MPPHSLHCMARTPLNVHGAIILVLAACLACGCIAGTGDTEDSAHDTLYQTSTIDALLEGVYDGDRTIGELMKAGDFGLGTVQALDGEMILLDGVAYQVRADGTVHVLHDDTLTPFAAVTRYGADRSRELSGPLVLSAFEQEVEALLPSRNISYAIRLDGTFSAMRTRSVPAQVPPYPPLLEVVQDQSVFELGRVQGTVVGFWMPYYVSGFNVPGFHLHFISDDRTAGGHVLDFELESGTLGIDDTPDLFLDCIDSPLFLEAPLDHETGSSIGEVER